MIWILHAIAYKFCKTSWIQKFLETKELPPLSEKGISTLAEIQEVSDKLIKTNGLEERDIILAFYDDESIINSDALDQLIAYNPYVFITDKEIRNYINVPDVTNFDIYHMVEKTTNLILHGNPFIWPTLDKEGGMKWESVSYKDLICGLYVFPDEEMIGIPGGEFLKPIAPKGKSPGAKKIVNGKKRDPINHLYVFNFRGHSWGMAFLKSCILRRIDLIDRRVYSKKKNAQVLYFSLRWIDPKRQSKKYWISTPMICSLLNWKFPRRNMSNLRGEIRNLLNYMLKEKLLKERWEYNKLDDLWYVYPAKPLSISVKNN